MSRVFVDTSAVLALLISTDEVHQRAQRAFARLREGDASLITTSYVLLETYALLWRRVGPEAVAAFRDEFLPLLEVVWVDQALHERSLDALVSDGRSAFSLVDACSMIVAAEQRVDAVFAFDRHFNQAGFELVE